MENAVLEGGELNSDEHGVDMEAGIYIEGSHGIRTENLMLCRKAEKNMYGQFMRFEFVTMVPIDLDGIDTQYMTEKDVELLNNYHKEVYEKISPYLYKIDSSRLLLLDFGQFDKREYSYICQDFGEAFYAAMAQLSDRLQNYRKLILFLARDSKHPKETCDYFWKYCADHQLECVILETLDDREVHSGEAYIAIRQVDVVEIVKKSRAAGLTCGVDFG